MLTDSLELLLDTICNMFGGVVFIALLIVLMLRTNAQVVSDMKDHTIAAILESLQAETEVMKSDLERLQNARAKQQEVLAQHVPTDLQQRLSQFSSLTQRLDDLENHALRIQESNNTRLYTLQQQRDKLTNCDQELRRMMQMEAELAAELQDGVLRETVRFPLARPIASKGIQISLRYGRVYFRHDPQLLTLDIAAPNEADYLILSGDADSVVVTPKPTGGLPVDGNLHLAVDFAKRLRGFKPADWHIAICTWPDSFGSFQSLREAIAQAGFRYTVLAADSAVQDRGGEIRPGQ
jgi:hypothetical protein